MASPICFVNTTKSWGGGEKWHYETALSLKTAGFEVSFVYQENGQLANNIKRKGMPGLRIDVSNLSFLNPVLIFKLKSYFKDNGIDTVVLNTSIDLKLAGIAAKLAGVRRIVYRRGSAIPVKNKWLNRYLLKNVCTDILANSEETKRTVLSIKKDLISSDKIRVIYNGIDINAFDKQIISEPLPTNPNTIVIGNLGRLVYQKGQEYLLELANKLQNRGINFKMRIGGEGALKGSLEELRNNYKLFEEVEFVGFVNSPKQFMSSIDLFVLSSRWEGFGYVLAEAMLMKKPCIVFDISSNPELVIDGENGYLVSPFDIEKMANRVEELVKNNELRAKVGERGRKIVESKFDSEKILPELIDYLKA